MICPYNYKKETMVRIPNIDAETAFITSEVTQLEYSMCECVKEDCAVWHEGKCHYNS